MGGWDFKIGGNKFNPNYPVLSVAEITEFLTCAIIEGRFEGGRRLIESDLQREFGVSRTPIRESDSFFLTIFCPFFA